MKAGFIPFFINVLIAQGKCPANGTMTTLLGSDKMLAAFSTYVQAQLPADPKPGDVMNAILAELPMADAVIKKANSLTAPGAPATTG